MYMYIGYPEAVQCNGLWHVLCQVNMYYQNTDSLLTNIVWSLMCYVVCTVQCEKESHEFDTGMQFRSDSLVQVVYDDPFKCYFQF